MARQAVTVALVPPGAGGNGRRVGARSGTGRLGTPDTSTRLRVGIVAPGAGAERVMGTVGVASVAYVPDVEGTVLGSSVVVLRGCGARPAVGDVPSIGGAVCSGSRGTCAPAPARTGGSSRMATASVAVAPGVGRTTVYRIGTTSLGRVPLGGASPKARRTVLEGEATRAALVVRRVRRLGVGSSSTFAGLAGTTRTEVKGGSVGAGPVVAFLKGLVGPVIATT